MLEVDKYHGKRKKQSSMRIFLVLGWGGPDLCVRLVRLLVDHVKEVGQVESGAGAFQAEEMASTKAKS